VELVKLVLKAISSQMDIVLHALLMQNITQLQKIVSARVVSSLINGEFALANAEPMSNIILRPKLVHAFLDWEESMVHVKSALLDQLQLLMDQGAPVARPTKF